MRVSFYLAGVMQGSNMDSSHVPQDYRQTIKNIILIEYPDAEIFCPMEMFPNAPLLNDEVAKSIIFKGVEIASEVEAVIAFLPEASMGTAVELWEAHNNSRVNIVISPMKYNLLLRTVADVIIPDISGFKEFVSSGKLKELLTEK